VLADPPAASIAAFCEILCRIAMRHRRLVYALRVLSEMHTAHRDMLIRDIIARMRHDGCGGRAGKVELSSLPHRSQVIRMYHDWNAASGSVQGDAASSVRTIYLHGSVP
jgi:hypothetical protein